MNDLKDYVYFHDWKLDAFGISEKNELVISMHDEDRHVMATFSGVSRCTLEHFGMVNIIYEMKIVNPGERNYEKAISMLAKSEGQSKPRARQIALLCATAGTELAVEFDTIKLTP